MAQDFLDHLIKIPLQVSIYSVSSLFNIQRLILIKNPFFQVRSSRRKIIVLMFLLIYDSQIYWSIVIKELSVKFLHPPKCILNQSDKSKQGGSWFLGAVLNIAECCIYPVPSQNKTDNSVAIIWRDEGFDDLPVNYVSVKELREQVM